MTDNDLNDSTSSSLITIGLTSSIASFISRCLLHPIDTVKSKLQVISQSNNVSIYNNIIINGKLSYKELYKGIGITAFGGVPAGCLYFTSYHIIRNYCYNNKLLNMNDIIIDFTSGLLAETISCIIWVPIDVCKERLQTQNELYKDNHTTTTSKTTMIKFNNSFDILRNNNIKCLYKGYWATLASFGPFSALYFTFAQRYKLLLYNYINNTSSSSSSSSTTTTTTTRTDITLPFHWNVLACALAGATASFITTPLDLVKLRLQVQRQYYGSNNNNNQGIGIEGSTIIRGSRRPLSGGPHFYYKSFIDGLIKLYKDDGGVRGMYKGCIPRMLFFAPNTALTMSIMEYLLSTIHQHKQEE